MARGGVARPGMSDFRVTAVVTCLGLLWEGAGAVAVGRCCPDQQAVRGSSGQCEGRTEGGQDWMAQLPPLVFSVTTEGYVNSSFKVGGPLDPAILSVLLMAYLSAG